MFLASADQNLSKTYLKTGQDFFYSITTLII